MSGSDYDFLMRACKNDPGTAFDGCLGVSDGARYLGIRTSTLRSAVHRGVVPAFFNKRSIRIRMRDLKSFRGKLLDETTPISRGRTDIISGVPSAVAEPKRTYRVIESATWDIPSLLGAFAASRTELVIDCRVAWQDGLSDACRASGTGFARLANVAPPGEEIAAYKANKDVSRFVEACRAYYMLQVDHTVGLLACLIQQFDATVLFDHLGIDGYRSVICAFLFTSYLFRDIET